MKRLLVVAGLFALLGQAAVAQAVLESDFTISVPNGSGDPVVESSTLVPLLEGTCYNWHLRLGKSKGTVAVTEVYTLPAPPASWEMGDDSRAEISADGRTATTPLSLTPEDGWIGSGWCVSAGDPEGNYVIEVRSGDEILETFAFELREM